MDLVKHDMGWIEVLVGPMFSGKSDELMRRLRRAQIAHQRVQIFKPAIDNRYAAHQITSHSGLGLNCENVSTANDILMKVQPGTNVIGIDEAQFFGDALVGVCNQLADLGKRVIVAGLDTDFRGRPFAPMPHLLVIAEEIKKLLASCIRCGNPAVHTQRLVESTDLIVVGGAAQYEARCRQCFDPNGVAQETLSLEFRADRQCDPTNLILTQTDDVIRGWTESLRDGSIPLIGAPRHLRTSCRGVLRRMCG